MRIASERGGSKGGIPVSLQDVSSSAARELLHHEARAAARDVRDNRRAAMNLRHQSQVDRECQLDLLPLAKTQIFRLNKHAVRAQILCFANSALPAGHHHVHCCARAVAGVQSSLHPYDLSVDCF